MEADCAKSASFESAWSCCKCHYQHRFVPCHWKWMQINTIDNNMPQVWILLPEIVLLMPQACSWLEPWMWQRQQELVLLEFHCMGVMATKIGNRLLNIRRVMTTKMTLKLMFSIPWFTTRDSHLTIKDQMKLIFVLLMFSEIVAEKYNQGIDSPKILSSLSDDDLASICDLIRRPGGLVW